MNTHKHTPGPWVASRMASGSFGIHSNPVDLSEPCSEIATTTDPHGFAGETAKANARLIAAAPQLLEALCGIVTMKQSVLMTPGNGIPFARAIYDAEAAIAAATGKEVTP